MRLIAKQGNRFAEIFRVNFYESRNVSVIGEYLLFKHLEDLIPTGINFHSHFIYVDDGNYHFSIKYYDTAEKVYVDRKTYFNQIAVRKGNSPEFSRTIPYERRDKVPGDMLDMFMMNEKLKPWSDRPLGHSFGSVSIDTRPNQLDKINTINSSDIKADDLVIDFDLYENRIVNFGASLFSVDNPLFDLNNLPPNLNVFENSIVRGDLVLRLNVIIV